MAASRKYGHKRSLCMGQEDAVSYTTPCLLFGLIHSQSSPEALQYFSSRWADPRIRGKKIAVYVRPVTDEDLADHLTAMGRF